MSKRNIRPEYQSFLDWMTLGVKKECDKIMEELKQEREKLVEQMRDRGFAEDEIIRVIYKNDCEPMYERGYMQRPH